MTVGRHVSIARKKPAMENVGGVKSQIYARVNQMYTSMHARKRGWKGERMHTKFQ